MKLLVLSVALACSSAVFAQDSKPSAPPTPTTPATPTAPPPPAPDDGTDPTIKRDIGQYNVSKDKPAIDGYDPVAYFPEGGGAAKKGEKKFAVTHRGVIYHFASKENAETFKKNPRKFEPAYGGWCAFAMGKTGEKVEIDPKSFRVKEGRLFLFYTDFFTDTREKWTKDEANLNPKADASWKKISGEESRKGETTTEAKPEKPVTGDGQPTEKK